MPDRAGCAFSRVPVAVCLSGAENFQVDLVDHLAALAAPGSQPRILT